MRVETESVFTVSNFPLFYSIKSLQPCLALIQMFPSQSGLDFYFSHVFSE